MSDCNRQSVYDDPIEEVEGRTDIELDGLNLRLAVDDDHLMGPSIERN